MSNIISKALTVVAVIFCVNVVWQQISDRSNYKSWPTAQARLISAEVVTSSSGRTNQPSGRHFLVETTYDFSVDGKVYHSDLNKIDVPRFSTDKEALVYLEKLKARSELIVHYHPLTPEKNELAR
jgi:hypothetical protein